MSVPAIHPARRRRWRPDKPHADKAYDNLGLRTEVRRRGIAVRIARKGVEFCLSWLMRHRRLVRP